MIQGCQSLRLLQATLLPHHLRPTGEPGACAGISVLPAVQRPLISDSDFWEHGAWASAHLQSRICGGHGARDCQVRRSLLMASQCHTDDVGARQGKVRELVGPKIYTQTQST